MRLIGCVLAPTCRRQTPMPDLSVVVCCSPRAGARALSTTCTDRCPAIRPTFCYIHDRQGTRQNHACTLKCTELQVHKCMYTQVFLKLHRWDWFWMITIRGSISCIRCEWVIHLCWMIKDYFAARKCRYLMKFVYYGPIYNKSALVQVMAWRRAGDKPWPESMMTPFPNALRGLSVCQHFQPFGGLKWKFTIHPSYPFEWQPYGNRKIQGTSATEGLWFGMDQNTAISKYQILA